MADGARDPHQRETFDQEIGVRNIVRFGVWLVILSVAAGVITWAFFELLIGDAEKRDVPPAPVVQREGAPVMPGPRLQTTPEADLAALRAEERRLTETYTWLDRERAIARVPVQRSIELLLEQGLPTRSGAPEWRRPVWRNPTHSRLRPEIEP